MDIQSPLKRTELFFQRLLDPKASNRKRLFKVELRLRMERGAEKILNQEKVREEINSILVKHVGKIGLANIGWQLVQLHPFEQETTLLLPSINSKNFLLFWSALAFQQHFKASIRDVQFEQLQDNE